MNRVKIKVLVVLGGFIILMLAALILDFYTRAALEARLTPYTTKFSPILPGSTITQDGLNADFFCSRSDLPRKAVIILGGSEGGKHWSTNTDYLQLLLDRGYCVMVLAYFHAAGICDDLREIPLEYFENAFKWLATNKQIIPDGYALVGHSRGGELALLLASRYPQIKVVAAQAPSSVVFPGSPLGLFDILAGQHSAWTYQGQPLPFVPWPISLQYAPSLLTGRQTTMFDDALLNENAVKSAAIPIEKASGPILCVSANQDEVWPSRKMCDQIITKLRQNNFPYYYEQFSHDYAHGWCGLQECWGKVVNFLDDYFESVPVSKGKSMDFKFQPR